MYERLAMLLENAAVALRKLSEENRKLREGITPDDPEWRSKFGIRARKVFVRLGINSIDDLLQKSGDDLLECKGLGITGLNDIRIKLHEMGFALKGDNYP
jgi:DNA-directed RNA polymerase alpha subunit